MPFLFRKHSQTPHYRHWVKGIYSPKFFDQILVFSYFIMLFWSFLTVCIAVYLSWLELFLQDKHYPFTSIFHFRCTCAYQTINLWWMDTVSLYQCSTLRAAHKLTKMCGQKYRYVMLYKNKWIWTLVLTSSFISNQFIIYWTKTLSYSQSVLANERLDFQVQAIFNVRLVYEILKDKMK